MIAQVRGSLEEASLSSVVVDVGGVGFELGISGITAASLPALGQEVRLYTRMQVREDAWSLFGFATKEERTLFDHLVILELQSTFAKDKGLSGISAELPDQLPLAPRENGALADANAALLSMGFTPQEAELALAGYDDGQATTEEMLQGALKRLGMGA